MLNGRLRRAAVVAGAVLGISLLPDAAVALPLTADRQCYVPGQDMVFNGSGFTPNGDVGFFFQLSGEHGNNILSPSSLTRADATGSFSATFGAPDLASSDDIRERVFASANDQARMEAAGPAANPDETAGFADLLLSRLDVFVAPWEQGKAKPRVATTFRAYGWRSLGSALYAHYLRKGKLVKTVKVGTLSGPCGDVTKRMKQFPFSPVRAGTYSVEFDAKQRYSNRTPGIVYRRVKVGPGDAVASGEPIKQRHLGVLD